MARTRPVGYRALIDRFGLRALPGWHESWVAARGTRRVEQARGRVVETYTSRYWPGDGVGEHLEFALKYDGVDLGVLAALFDVVDEREIVAYVALKPTGKYARKLWFLYELLTERRLPLDDLRAGNYVDLLPPDDYYCASPARRSRRHRINDNLLGDASFCPMVRRTERLRACTAADLAKRCRDVVGAYPTELLRRALSYLYTRETKSSFAIESVQPDGSRTERFIGLLRVAETEDFVEKARLLEVQNRVVDERFAETDYRALQNYVGESIAWGRERVHFVPPRPEDLAGLMEGLARAHHTMTDGDVDPVVHAAVVAYGFVFLHPFEDGNGRIHRFLIHNILARRGLTPPGLIFPVSAAMLRRPAEYDASLETFSRPLLSLLSYDVDDEGRMSVDGETAKLYRYIDLTAQAEALYAFIETTIETELVEELDFLSNYERMKSGIQTIVDMPDRHIDLFIRFCLQNGGRLSARKRQSHFPALTDDEVVAMERVVKDVVSGPSFSAQ